ncbi:MAG: DEAD/DEAH box helicase [Rhodospirillales bacterium]
MKFTDLGLSDELLRAVHEAGYEEPTPIQEKAIPVVMMGRDVLGCAQTGTGKTASFTLPMIDILAAGRAKARMPRSLILEPTRELAAQVADNFEVYGKYHKLSKALLIGGSSMEEQLKVLNRGVDVLIATPGRLLDVFDRGHLLMNDVKVLVIDEADRMLDMGFIPDVEKIVSLLSPMRTTLLFSATMPKEIRRLADKFLSNPKEISVSPPASTADTIAQGLVKLKSAGRAPGAAQKVKREALRKLIRDHQDTLTNALVFCNRKRDVDVVYRSLERHGFSAARLHGDMVQSVRTDTLDKFKKNEVKILVCSDVAARGLDISTVSHVFNFDVPTHAEDYVHRIGRTGRAGRKGNSFTLLMPDEKKYLDAIEKLIGKPIPVLEDNSGGGSASPEKEEKAEEKPKRGRSRGGKPKSDAKPKSEEAPARDTKKDSSEDNSRKKPSPKKAAGSGRKPAQKDNRKNKDDDGAFGEHTPAFLKKEVPLGKR